MIWESTKTATAIVRGEEINFTFRVPSMRDYEELSTTDKSNETYLKKFLISCDGFDSAEAMCEAGGAQLLIGVIIQTIGEAAAIPASLKNA